MKVQYAIEKVNIRKIIPDVDQPRKHYDLVKLKELADSIESAGLINPPIAEKINGKYKLVVGHRRWLAALIAGATHIYIKKVKSKLTALQRLEMQIHEDSQEAFLPWVRALNYYKHWSLLKEKEERQGEKYTLQEYCKRIGRGESTVRSSINYATNLTQELKNSVMDGYFDYTNAKEVARVRVPMSKLEELGIDIKNNSFAYLNEFIKDLKKKRDEKSKKYVKEISDLVEKTKYEQIRIAQWIKQEGKKLSKSDLETRIARANQELKEEKFEFKVQRVKEGISKYIKDVRIWFDEISDMVNKVLGFSRLEPQYREGLLKSHYGDNVLLETLSQLDQNVQNFESNIKKYSTLLNRLELHAKETYQDIRSIDALTEFALKENEKRKEIGEQTSYFYKPLIKHIPIELIAENPENARGDYFNPEGLLNLASSIAEVGLLNPILIRRIKGRKKKYEIIVGHRRYRVISQKLGWKRIDCFIQDDLSREDVLNIQIIEDSQKEWLKEERAEAWSKYYDVLKKEGKKLTLKEFSRKIGKSHGTVKKALAFDMLLNKKAKEMYLQGLITYSSATLISEQEKIKQYAFALESALGYYKIPTLKKRIRHEQANKHNLKLFKEDKETFRETVFSEFGQRTTARLFFFNKSLEKILEKESSPIFKDDPVIYHFFKLRQNLQELNKHMRRIHFQ